jgi:catechol 2,3-dioxygenase-like lactoylglutathione lyase family enzyme
MHESTREIGLLHHVEIYVDDLVKTRHFWSWFLNKLGYSLYQDWQSGFSFMLGNTYLVFVQTEEKYRDKPFHRCYAGLNHLAFWGGSKEMLDELKSDLEEMGITILYPEKYPHAGGIEQHVLFFEDPNRLKVEVVAQN